MKLPSSLWGKITLFGLILLILIGIPLGTWVVKQRQTTQQRASTSQTNQSLFDSCNLVEVSVSESPSCAPLATIVGGVATPIDPSVTNNIPTYTTTFTFTNHTSTDHTVAYKTFAFRCNSPYQSPSGGACTENEQSVEDKTVIVPAGQSVNVTVTQILSDTGSTPAPEAACGTVQSDMGIFSVDGDTTCVYKYADGNPWGVGAAGVCETGRRCPVTVNTPTPTLEITTTPGPTATPGPTNTPAPGPTNTPTPGPTSVANTPTPTPITVLPSTGFGENLFTVTALGSLLAIMGSAVLIFLW